MSMANCLKTPQKSRVLALLELGWSPAYAKALDYLPKRVADLEARIGHVDTRGYGADEYHDDDKP
jgi:hypothetical protein